MGGWGGLPDLTWKLPQEAQTVSDTAGKVKDTIESPGKAVASAIFSSTNVMILLGLLLIAAGIFSFDKTRELVVAGAKTARAAGEAAAAA